MNNLSPRQQAKATGEKKYHGRPCKKCGATLRYVCRGRCVECAKKATADYGNTSEGKEVHRIGAQKHRDRYGEEYKIKQAAYQERYAQTPEGKQKRKEANERYLQRIKQGLKDDQ